MGFAVFCVYMSAYCIFLLIVYSMCSFSTLILLVGSSDLYQSVARITYTVLVETLNHVQSMHQKVPLTSILVIQ